MKSTLIIRPAKEVEAAFLSEFTLLSKSYWGYDTEFLELCRPHLVVTINDIKNCPVIVAEEGNVIRGYFSLKNVSDENRLDNLWIHPDYIGNGLGKILFKEAVKTARALGWEKFRLASEPKAVVFYEKMGAEVIGEVQSRLRADLFLPHMEMLV